MIGFVAAVSMAFASLVGGGQDPAPTVFEHYEAIRVALSADELKGIPAHATALTTAPWARPATSPSSSANSSRCLTGTLSPGPSGTPSALVRVGFANATTHDSR